jgi:hypothetical protein
MEVKQPLTDAELDAREYRRFEREYKEWCKKFDPNYVVETEEEDNES